MEKHGILSDRDVSKLYELQIGLSDGRYKALSNRVMHQLADLCPSKITMWIYMLHRSKKKNLDPSIVAILDRHEPGRCDGNNECDYVSTPGY